MTAQLCRLLVVEDHVDSAVMLSTFLSMVGHLVRVAYNADTALDIVHEFQPNVCLCDIGLPKTSGYELAPRLRSQLPETLLIAVTGRVGDQIENSATTLVLMIGWLSLSNLKNY